MSPDWSSSAGFVIVLVLFLAAIGVATLAVAAWTLLVARWEDRRRTYVITQRTESTAAPFTSIDGSGNVRVIREKQ